MTTTTMGNVGQTLCHGEETPVSGYTDLITAVLQLAVRQNDLAWIASERARYWIEACGLDYAAFMRRLASGERGRGPQRQVAGRHERGTA